VVRVAGNVIEPGGLASLEYGANLGTKLIFVLGHTQCGAVTATLEAVKSGTTLPGNLPALVDLIKPAVQRVLGEPGDQLTAAVEANVADVISKHRGCSPVLSDRLSAGTLRIAGGVYELASGLVRVTAP
jgi:carbonic anhydrase